MCKAHRVDQNFSNSTRQETKGGNVPEESVYYFHSQQSISVADQAAEIGLTTLIWEEVIKQDHLDSAKLEPLCEEKPFQTREGIRIT